MGLPRVLLVRHGETAYNRPSPGASAERVRGWIDVPLDQAGIEQAKRQAQELAHWPIDRIYSSDLCRAEQTARAIAVTTGVPVLIRFELRPWNVGKLAGKPVDEVLPQMQLLSEHETRAAPGGEPFAEFRKRFLGYLRQLIAEARSRQHCIVAVAHTRNLQIARAWIEAGARADLSIDTKVMNDYSKEIGTAGKMVIAPEAVAA